MVLTENETFWSSGRTGAAIASSVTDALAQVLDADKRQNTSITPRSGSHNSTDAVTELAELFSDSRPFTSATLYVEAFLHWLTRASIRTPRGSLLRGYLVDHLGLIPTVSHVCADARDYFHPDAELSLKLYQDPEIDDTYLTLYVRRHDYPTDFLDTVDNFVSDAGDILCGGVEFLHVTTDFAQPATKDDV